MISWGMAPLDHQVTALPVQTAWHFPGEHCLSPRGSVSPAQRSLCQAKPYVPGIGMKFCHGAKHGNLQHSPQLHPVPFYWHQLLPQQMHCPIWTLAMSKIPFCCIHTTPNTCQELFSCQTLGRILDFVFHGAYAPLSPPRAGLLCQHLCFTPRLLPARVSPPLATALLSFTLGSLFPLFFSRSIFYWGASSNILC